MEERIANIKANIAKLKRELLLIVIFSYIVIGISIAYIFITLGNVSITTSILLAAIGLFIASLAGLITYKYELEI